MNAMVDPKHLAPAEPTVGLQRPDRPLILVVDDHPDNLLMLGELLEDQYALRMARSGPQALASLAMKPIPDLVLLDLMMPGMDGYEVIRRIRADAATAQLPVILVTAHDAREVEAQALQLGAVDYVAKPIHPPVLMARVATHLALKQARDQLASQNASLEAEVARRTRDIQLVKQASIRALASVGETRDNETGLHILRTQLYIEVLGRRLQHHPRFAKDLTPARLQLIVEAAPLHDIGKIGIRDHILLKPGKLTPEEFAIMKTHAALGGEALGRAIRDSARSIIHDAALTGAEPPPRRPDGGDPLEFLEIAREIAMGHHEKWDGSGYPAGLAGDAIPVSARLMALADVFDALISRRVYKAAFPIEEVRRIIAEGRGTHFDPALVDAFFDAFDEVLTIARRYADEAGSTL